MGTLFYTFGDASTEFLFAGNLPGDAEDAVRLSSNNYMVGGAADTIVTDMAGMSQRGGEKAGGGGLYFVWVASS